MHQVLLHNMELRHYTGKHSFCWICFNFFQFILNCASGACQKQGGAARDGAPDCFNVIIIICLNCASGAAPQQGVAAPDRALLFYFILICFE